MRTVTGSAHKLARFCIVLCCLGQLKLGYAQQPRPMQITTVSQGATTDSLVSEIVSGAFMSVVPGSVSTEINAFGGGSFTDPRSIGRFEDGMTPAGAPLPTLNGGPALTYAGGIDIDTGICLCTGAASDDDPIPGQFTAPSGFGVGMQGPNNGFGLGNPGEISWQLFASTFFDEDFQRAVYTANGLTIPQGSGDPAVLHFVVDLARPGHLTIRNVFGSDENDAWIDREFLDSFGILIKKASAPNTDYQNIVLLKQPGLPDLPFTLDVLEDCGPPLFIENQVGAADANTPGGGLFESPHAIDGGAPRYDVEFGGFSSRRTWETPQALAPGQYTIKIVVHDIADRNVDAGLFIETGSLKHTDFLPADYNLDGVVDGSDYIIHQQNYNENDPIAGFEEGDSTGDGLVNYADLSVLMTHWGATGGNVHLTADFNGDGCVDEADLAIWTAHFYTAKCAGRDNGDADGDGDVDGADHTIYQQQHGICNSGSQQAQSGGGGPSAAVAGPQAAAGTAELQPIPAADNAPTGELSPEEQLLQEADLNGDDQIDRDELLAHWMKTTGGTPE